MGTRWPPLRGPGAAIEPPAIEETGLKAVIEFGRVAPPSPCLALAKIAFDAFLAEQLPRFDVY